MKEKLKAAKRNMRETNLLSEKDLTLITGGYLLAGGSSGSHSETYNCCDSSCYCKPAISLAANLQNITSVTVTA